ncbi:MAG: hypothetical protein OEV54_06395 [Dehalococcoidia bacterium]|nr:hypothetical protein [Dehalococcoidia bacterium]
MKLLPAALQRQDYSLAAHVLVYGLVKASLKNPGHSPNLQASQNRYGRKRQRQEKG